MAPERGKTILFGREKKGRGEDKTRDPPPRGVAPKPVTVAKYFPIPLCCNRLEGERCRGTQPPPVWFEKHVKLACRSGFASKT